MNRTFRITLLLGLFAMGPTPGCLAAAIESTSAPLTAPAEQSSVLARLLGGDILSRKQLATVISATTDALVRQNLRALDPALRLSDEQRHALSARLAADIRPAVEQAVRSADIHTQTDMLADCLTRRISAEDRHALVVFYHSTTGKHYLEFSAQLDGLVGAGLSRIASQPVSFNRSQMSDSVLLTKRRRLIDMSTPVLQLQSAVDAKDRHSSAVTDLAIEFLSIESGTKFDQLAQRYAAELPAFSDFQRTRGFQQQIRAESEWSQGLLAHLAPVLQQTENTIALMRPGWESLIHTMQPPSPASAPQ
jgi:hypothetical protein